jgi:outer membrane protein
MNIRKSFSHAFLLIFLAFLFNIGELIAQNTWTLQQCIEYAFENNIQIKQSRLQTQTAEINLLQSKLDFAPSANGNASLGNSWGRNFGASNVAINKPQTSNSFGLNSSLMLFNGMQKWNTLKKSETDLKASEYVSEEMENNISLLLTRAYLNILLNHELLLVSVEQLDVTQKQIERTEKLLEAGTLPKGDLLEIKAQAAIEETNLISSENALALAYLDLKQFLDLPAESDFEIDRPDLQLSTDLNIIPSEQVYVNAVETMPEIKRGEMDLESAVHSVKIAKGYLYPSLSLNAGISTNYFSTAQRAIFDENGVPIPDGEGGFLSEDIPYWDQIDLNTGEYLTLNLNVPIFNGYAAKSQVKRAQVQSISQSFELQLRKLELRKTIEQQYYDAIAAYKTYNASKISVESLKESFKYTEEKFNLGMVNSIDYSLAKMKLTQAESELLSNKYDYIFKTKILDFYMGIPITL